MSTSTPVQPKTEKPEISGVTGIGVFEGDIPKQGEPWKSAHTDPRGRVLIPQGAEKIRFYLTAKPDADATGSIQTFLKARGLSEVTITDYKAHSMSDEFAGTNLGMMMDARDADVAEHFERDGYPGRAPRSGWGGAMSHADFHIVVPVKGNETLIQELSQGLHACVQKAKSLGG